MAKVRVTVTAEYEVNPLYYEGATDYAAYDREVYENGMCSISELIENFVVSTQFENID